MVLAGEVSGDLQASSLVKELLKLDPTLDLFGFGGAKMAEAGVRLLKDMTPYSSVGLIESFKFIPGIKEALAVADRVLMENRPDLVLMVDNQGFNNLIAKKARALKIRTVYYIPPQEWLWGVKGGAERIARSVDKLIAIFKPEYDIYQKAGADVSFVGHPLLDIVPQSYDRSQVIRELGLKETGAIVALFPGSRYQEIHKISKLLAQSVLRIRKELPDAQFVLSVASPLFLKELEEEFRELSGSIKFFTGKNYEIMQASDLILLSSGTATLEAAILEKPMVVVYRVSPVSYWAARALIKVKYAALPNLLMGREIVPELLQRRANPEAVSSAALELLQNRQRQEMVSSDFKKLKASLGSPGALSRAAQIIMAELKKVKTS